MAGEFTKGIAGGLALRKAREQPTSMADGLLKDIVAAKKRRREEDLAREKEDRQLINALTKIKFEEEEKGKQARLTQKEKPLSIKEHAFQAASQNKALPGFTFEETKKAAIGGTNINIGSPLDTLRSMRSNAHIGDTVTGGSRIRVRKKSTGQTGTIEPYEFDPAIYERL